MTRKTHFLRIQAQSVDNIREKAKKDSREGVPKHEFNFNAKYVPFASSDKSETYSLDEVIYRSKNGGLLDVEHDMEALGKYPPGTFVCFRRRQVSFFVCDDDDDDDDSDDDDGPYLFS